MRKDGTCWVNIGDTYGGSGCVTNDYRTEANKSIQGIGKNVNLYKTGGIAQRIDYQSKSLCLIPFRFAIGMVDRGWILRNTIIWKKNNCMPSSVKDRFTVDFEYVFFFVKNKKYWFEQQFENYAPASDVRYRQRLKAGKNYDCKEPYKENMPYHTIKRRSNDKDGLCVGGDNEQGRNKRCVWTINTKPFKGAHFAVFPEALVEPMIKSGCPEFVCKKCGKAKEKIYKNTGRLIGMGGYGSKTAEHIKVSPTSSLLTKKVKEKQEIGYTDCGCNVGFEGGVAVDPFGGSGTVGVVAKKLNRQFILIDLNQEYVDMAEK